MHLCLSASNQLLKTLLQLLGEYHLLSHCNIAWVEVTATTYMTRARTWTRTDCSKEKFVTWETDKKSLSIHLGEREAYPAYRRSIESNCTLCIANPGISNHIPKNIKINRNMEKNIKIHRFLKSSYFMQHATCLYPLTHSSTFFSCNFWKNSSFLPVKETLIPVCFLNLPGSYQI